MKGVQRQIAWQKKIDKFEMQLIDILLNHWTLTFDILLTKWINSLFCLLLSDKLLTKSYFFEFLGCVLQDIEILGGDLTAAENGQGFFAEQDDDCARECEQNADCQ